MLFYRRAAAIAIFGGISLSMPLARPAIAQPRAESLTQKQEPFTRTTFPVNLFGFEARSSVHWLLAISVRCMLGMCSIEMARAYSYGIYMSEVGLRRLKVHMNDKKLDENELRKFLIPEPGSKYPSVVLRLAMLRQVKTDHVVHGFDTTLYRYMGKEYTAQEEKRVKFLDAIRDQPGNMFQKGDEIDLVRLPEGRLEVVINGETKALIESEEISKALLEAYIGPKGHLSYKARDSLIERTEELLTLF